MKKRVLIVLLCFVGALSSAFAAEKKVQGVVISSEDNLPLIGASVYVTAEDLKKAGSAQTTMGVITDVDGQFSIAIPTGITRFFCSYVGYDVLEVKLVPGKEHYEITLHASSQMLDAVVVTGYQTVERRKLTAAVSKLDISDETIGAVKSIDQALAGQIAGLSVSPTSGAPGAPAKIRIRGTASLNGTQDPLWVLDGIPLEGTDVPEPDELNDITNMKQSSIAGLNPADIENITILKDAAATAIYGARAANGVIVITTKKGTKSEGLGVTFSGSVSVENVFMKPERQTIFGQGSNGIFNATSSSNWGPAITGQSYTDWNGRTQNMQYFDNVANFFKTGVNLTENIAFSQQFDRTSVYLSATRMDDFSKIPGAEYSRTNLMSRITSSFGKDNRWSVDAKVQYILSDATNRPISGARSDNYFYSMYMMPISLDIREFKQAKNPEDGKMYWWEKGSGQNPYWAKDYNTNQDKRNRFLLNGSLKYQITDWLNAEIKAGSDMYFTETETKLYAGSPSSENGRYSFGEQKFYENNFSFLVTAQKDRVLGDFGGVFTFGGNLMERKSTGVSNSVSALTVPDLFWLTNSTDSNRSISQTYTHRKTNSLYGTLGVNYDGWAFLDLTGRNDWSSTLSKSNRSFFYPSISASWVISDMINNRGKGMPEWFTYAKARVSFAQVGNDLDPYQLYNVYGIGSIYETGGTIASVSGSTLFNEDVRSELISSWEAGAEVRFFNNRLGLDVAWYKSNAKRQLLNLPMNSLSGFSSMKINAGNIQNSGVEIMLNATPVQTKEFTWDTQVNFSTNKNKIIELADGINAYDNLKILAVAGGNYGEIWGTTYLRVTDENSPYYGKMLLNDAGLPQGDSKIQKIGDQQATCLVGWTNTFSYKNFTLSFLVDARIGGEIFSGSNRMLQANGVAACTVVNGKRDKFVVDGVIADGNGGYSPSTIEVEPQSYWTAVTGSTGNMGIGEANLYDATNVRLRNVSLNYTFPRKMLAKGPFQQVKLGMSCNNVWMIHSNLHGIDPESVFATSTNATGFENASSPTSRTFLFNVTLGF